MRANRALSLPTGISTPVISHLRQPSTASACPYMPDKLGRLTFILTCMVLAFVACDSQSEDTAEKIDRLMSAYRGNVPGASVLVIRDGTIVFRRAYGLSDLDRRVAATPATNYRLASMTKQFTAAAILLLAQEARLSLDDPIRKWLPTLPTAAAPITVRHLLTHVSGLVDYEEIIPEGQSRQLHDTRRATTA